MFPYFQVHLSDIWINQNSESIGTHFSDSLDYNVHIVNKISSRINSMCMTQCKKPEQQQLSETDMWLKSFSKAYRTKLQHAPKCTYKTDFCSRTNIGKSNFLSFSSSSSSSSTSSSFSSSSSSPSSSQGLILWNCFFHFPLSRGRALSLLPVGR